MSYIPDYYTPPDDHPRQAEMDQIQDQIDTKRERINALESLDRDWIDQEEDEYRALEDEITSLERHLTAVYEGE